MNVSSKWALIGMVLIVAIPVGVANSQTDMVPDWIRQSMGLYSEGLITDADFINSIQYLIGQGIINVSDDTPDRTPDTPDYTQDTSDYDDLLERQNILIDIMLEKERLEIHNSIVNDNIDVINHVWDEYDKAFSVEIAPINDKLAIDGGKDHYIFYAKQSREKYDEYEEKRLQYIADHNNATSQYLRCDYCLDTLERLSESRNN